MADSNAGAKEFYERHASIRNEFAHPPDIPAIVKQLRIFDVLGLLSLRDHIQDALWMANVHDMVAALDTDSGLPNFADTFAWVYSNSTADSNRLLSTEPPPPPPLSLPAPTHGTSSSTTSHNRRNRRTQINMSKSMSARPLHQPRLEPGADHSRKSDDSPAMEQKLGHFHTTRAIHKAVTDGR